MRPDNVFPASTTYCQPQVSILGWQEQNPTVFYFCSSRFDVFCILGWFSALELWKSGYLSYQSLCQSARSPLTICRTAIHWMCVGFFCFSQYHDLKTQVIVLCENLRRSTLWEILSSTHLAPKTMPLCWYNMHTSIGRFTGVPTKVFSEHKLKQSNFSHEYIALYG